MTEFLLDGERRYQCLTVLCALPLADTEDDKLRRLHRRDTDFNDQLSHVAYFNRIQFFVAFDIKCLLGGCTEQGARAPDAGEEGADIAFHPFPQIHVVRLEHHPLRAVLNRTLDEVEQAADVEIPPCWVAGDGACAPDANAAAR